MGSISFDISGLDFDKVAQNIRDRLPEALAAGMEVIHAAATPNVPVESGNLVGSGSVTATEDGASLTYDGPYARYQEFGVYYRHGRYGAPLSHTHGTSFFLTGAVAAAGQDAIDMVGRRLFEGL